MKIVCMIPARLGSTRLPNKLLQKLGNKSVIATTYTQVVNTKLFDEVMVVCDDNLLANEITAIGGKTFLSTTPHETGTDRIAEFAHLIDADIIVNVQGDEPFTNQEVLQQLIAAFDDTSTKVASLMYVINEQKDIENPNFVKVIIDKNSNAIYFSRSPIPYNRDKILNINYYKHIGIYAFTKETLMQFATLPSNPLEQAEKLENLRLVFNNIPIKMVETTYRPIGIDTLEDLEKARKMVKD